MRTRYFFTAMVALALVAGCSGGKPAARTSPTPSADIHKMMLDVAQCARAHGAPNFPDPVMDARGHWDFPESAQRQPKVAVCDALVIRMKRAHPQKARPTVSPQDLVKLKEYAACMRQQGVSDWPDPTPNGTFKLPPRLRNAQRFREQDKACYSKIPKVGIQIEHGPAGSAKGS
ncbi:hypothetical protein ACRYCC_15470 [Actinomadura scrupuli]|uniref:hypothetical protein n=1 Tax=Actinomadura scrupuli TaxID=559629 RepID=UPI003D9655A7